jgi:hypothetical protein
VEENIGEYPRSSFFKLLADKGTKKKDVYSIPLGGQTENIVLLIAGYDETGKEI